MTPGLAITGTTGFLGHHLLRSLSLRPDVHVRALSRQSRPPAQQENVSWIQGDLGDPATAARLMVADGTLIHLAHPPGWPLENHLAAVAGLADAAAARGMRRVVHCSTAAVAGAANARIIDESTPPQPSSNYEIIKLAIEEAWRAAAGRRFDLVIARPTAVFGSGGRNLLKLVEALRFGNPLVNYLRSSLFGARRMHLVHVDAVVSALEWLAFADQPWQGRTFIIADDDDPLNNFRDVERILRREFGVTAPRMPPVAVPQEVLALALRLAGRSNTDPQRRYDSRSLRDTGWRPPANLEQGLRSFAAACRNDANGSRA